MTITNSPSIAREPVEASCDGYADGSATHGVSPHGRSGVVPGRRLWSIQYLRALAASMVVLFHAGHVVARLGYAGYWPRPLFWSGVDIFFVISGVVIWHSTVRRPLGPGGFWLHRARRLVPLYWLTTVAAALILLVAPGMMSNGRLDIAHLVASLLFAPWRNPATGLIQPIIVPGWSLNAEMFFYLVFGLCLIVDERWRIVTVTACLIVTVTLARLLSAPGTAIAFYADDIMLEFSMGLVLGWGLDRGWSLPAPLAVPLAVGSVAALALLDDLTPHFLAAGLPALCLVGATVAIEARRRLPRVGALMILGDASYALYLTHGFILSLVGRMLLWSHVRVPDALAATIFASVGLMLSIVAALLVYRYVEVPLNRAVRRIL